MHTYELPYDIYDGRDDGAESVIGYGFVINNYFDVEIDKRHTKKSRAG